MKIVYLDVSEGTESPDAICVASQNDRGSYRLPRRVIDALAIADYIDREGSNGNSIMIKREFPSWIHRPSECLVIDDGDLRMIFGRTAHAPDLSDYGRGEVTQLVTCKVCDSDHDVKGFFKWEGQYVCGNCFFSLRRERRMSIRDYISQRNLATPRWVNRDAIAAIYDKARWLTFETGIQHHVDHEIPLRNPSVSGLHVPANLRVITATENCSKGNKFNRSKERTASRPVCYSSNADSAPTKQDAPKSSTNLGSQGLPRLRKRIQASSA